MFDIFLVLVIARHRLDRELKERFTNNVPLALKLIIELDKENMAIPPPLKMTYGSLVFLFFSFFLTSTNLYFDRRRIPRGPKIHLFDPEG